MTNEQKKIVYDDEKVLDMIGYLCSGTAEMAQSIAAMLQQLLDERDGVLKDLKALEAEVRAFRIDKGGIIRADTDRSEKYEKGETSDNRETEEK